MNRRKAMKNAALGLGAISLSRSIGATDAADQLAGTNYKTNHSTCKWCYSGIALEELYERGQEIGLQSIELTTVDEWPILKKYGMTCAMGTLAGFSIEDGWNELNNLD